MLLRIDRDDEFVADLEVHLAYLTARGEVSWILRLQEDLARAATLLTAFPESGASIGGRQRVRRLRFRRTPYVLWYSIDAGRRRLTLLRLFHAYQRMPS